MSHSDDQIREAALARARQDRKCRDAVTPPRRRQAVQPSGRTADDRERERISIDALHAAGRGCGRVHCPRCAVLAETSGKDQA